MPPSREPSRSEQRGYTRTSIHRPAEATFFNAVTVSLLIFTKHTDRLLTFLLCVTGHAACLEASPRPAATCSYSSVLRRFSTLNIPSNCTAPSSSTAPSAASASCSCTFACWRRRGSLWRRSRITSHKVSARGVACDTHSACKTLLRNVSGTLGRPQWAMWDYEGLNTVNTTNMYYYDYDDYYYFKVTCFDQLWSSSGHKNHKKV